MLGPQYQRDLYQLSSQSGPMQDEAGLGPVRAKFPGPGGPSRDMRPDETQQPQPLASFLAPETVHQTLQSLASSYDQDDKNTYKKTIYVKTTTTKPPIVWFPGDPDCGEGDLGGNSKMDTFQLIAFLLSIFNVASIMVSNVNNNNNNNNINDNGDNVNDNNINESNTNAMVSSMSNVGLMGKRKRRSVAHLGPETSNLIMEEELHKTIWDMFSLVIKSHLMRSITCLEKLFCEASASVMTRGGFSAVVAEMSSLAISKSLPNLNRDQERRIVQAGKYGRAGLNCSEIFDKCEEENWNFSNMAEAFTWSPVASLTSMEKLVSWAYNKK